MEWFEEIRDAVPRPLWSRGVEIARAGAVREERRDEMRALLRIDAPRGRKPYAVELGLSGSLLGSFDCDCGGPDDPCEHVAGAAIALRRALQEGTGLPAVEKSGEAPLAYELRRVSGGLALDRFVVTKGERTAIRASLRAIASGRVSGPAFQADDVDWEIDEAMRESRGEAIARGELPGLLRHLARVSELRFDGEVVRVESEVLSETLVVEDVAGGFRLRLERPRGERLAPGVVLAEGTLFREESAPLSGRERRDYSRGHFVPYDAAAELAGETLRDLEGRVTLAVRSKTLPRDLRAETPRLEIHCERREDALLVRADLLYGDPPRARVEGDTLVSLGGALPLRDRAAERRLFERVAHTLKIPTGVTARFEGDDAFAAAEALGAFADHLRDDTHRAFFRTAPAHFDLPEGAAFRPRFRVSGQSEVLDAASVVEAWERGREWVALPSGGFAPLPSDWLDRYGRTLAALLEARREDDRIDAALQPDLAALCAAQGAPPPAAWQHFRDALERYDAVEEAPLPDDLRATLRSYQREGVRWLAARREAGLGALLADDMGLGKTIQALCALPRGSLVVAPTSVLPNWQDEIARFRPGLRCRLYHGATRTLDPEADLTLTSYALLRLDIDTLAAREWEAVALDEAQAIKNPESQVARAAFRLSAKWRLSLTGTPIENRLDELWSQSRFTNPALFGARESFVSRYRRPIEAGSERVADELRARLAPFVLRRLKQDVAKELPPRTDVVIRCTLSEEERDVYDAIRHSTRSEVAEQLGKRGGVMRALEALLRLRQAACHRDLLPGERCGRSSKVDLLLEHLDTAVAEGHQALVFSQWTGLLDRIEPVLREAGLAFLRLDGSTRDRGAVVSAFQTGEAPLLLISLRAGGTGLNLTAADHVFLVDPWWNPAVEEQAADRAHRIGQTKPVFFHRLVASDTVEERMLALQERKRTVARSALTAGAASALSREELLELLD